MNEKLEQPEIKTYEFPIVVNSLNANPMMPQTPYSYQKMQEFMSQRNLSHEDFNVQIGHVTVDLNPYKGFQINGAIDVLDKTLAVNQNLSEFLNSLHPSNPMKQNLQMVLANHQLDPTTMTLKSAKLVGPNFNLKAQITDGFGMSGGANLGGIKLVMQKEGEHHDYQLSISGMLGANAGLVFSKSLTGKAKTLVKNEMKFKNEMELGAYGFKIGFSIQPKELTPKPTTPMPLKDIVIKTNQSTQTPIEKKTNQPIPQKEITMKTNPSTKTPTVKSSTSSFDLASSSVYKNIKGRLQGIQESQSVTSEKVSLLLGEIRTAYQAINEQQQMAQLQRNQEIVRANFQGVIDGFNFINQIGQMANNKGVERFGMAGLSLAQGTLGVAQLTGTLGMTAVTGLSMITPITTVATAALSLGSLVFNFGHHNGKRQSRALQRQFQQLSEQIIQIYSGLETLNRNMTRGFEATMAGLDTINKNLDQGFSSIHDAMHHYFSRMGTLVSKQYEDLAKRIELGVGMLLENQETLFDSLTNGFTILDFKLDDLNLHLAKMDRNLEKVLAQLQQLSLRSDIQQRQTMYELTERYTYAHNDDTLFKLLQAIRGQLLSARGPLKSLPAQGNHLTGWYQLNLLASLFQHPMFHDFPFDFAQVVNLDWAESAFECLTELMPALANSKEDLALKKLQNEVFQIVTKSGKTTAELINTLASEQFLHTFFLYYTNKLDSIQKSAEAILSPLREQHSKESMHNYAENVLAQAKKSPNLREGLLKTINDNTYGMAKNFSDATLFELAEKAAEYNNCLDHLKQATGVLFSILQLDNEQSIKVKIDSLQPIPTHYYHSKGIAKVKGDKSLAKDSVYFYIDMNTDNRFHSFRVTPEELHSLADESRNGADISAGYLDILANVANIHLMTAGILDIPAEPDLFRHLSDTGIKLSMKIKLRQEDIDQTLQLMKEVTTIAAGARGKSVVYVMGVTGDGKSTLINDLNGSRYNKVRVEGDSVPELDVRSQSEVCKVGTSSSQSETLVPQLIDVPYDDQRITYCDLPGLDGSRERAVTVYEAYAPMFLNAEVDKVQGILWVLSDLHFKTIRSKEVKEILSALLQIAKRNPETVVNSLTMVITKGSKYLTKENVIKKLRSTVDAMTNSAEKELLHQIITALESSERDSLIISQLYERENSYRSDIHRAILAKRPMAKDDFDFSFYSKEQVDFKHQVDKALQHRKLVLTEFKSARSGLKKCNALIEIQSKQDAQLRSQQELMQSEFSQLKNKIHELSTLSLDYQNQINTVERSEELVKIHDIKQKIAGQTCLVEVKVPTVKYIETVETYDEKIRTGYVTKQVDHPHGPFGPYHLDSHRAVNNYWTDRNSLTQQGYTSNIVYYDGNPNHVVIYATKTIADTTKPTYKTETRTRPITVPIRGTKKETISKPVPMDHPLEYTLSFPASYPVAIKVNNSQGWKVKPDSEQKDSGYKATIIYEQGVGCLIDLVILVLKKYTPEGKQIIAEKQRLKNQVDREIITLNQQLIQLEGKISKNEEMLTALQIHLSELAKQKRQFEEDHQIISEYLEENQPYFDSLDKVSTMLEAKRPVSSRLSEQLYRFHKPALPNNENSNADPILQLEDNEKHSERSEKKYPATFFREPFSAIPDTNPSNYTP